MILLLGLGLILSAFACLLAFDTAFKPRSNRQATLRRVVSYSAARAAPRAPAREKLPGLFDAVVPLLGRIALKTTPKAQVSDLQARLAASGLASRLQPQQYLALKTVLGFFAIVLGVASGGVSVRGFVLVVFFLGCSLVLPDFALGRMGRRRAERLSEHLPQAIDQIVVSLEAGLGFDAAVSYYVQRDKTPLGAELRFMLAEIRMGTSRIEALKRLAERVPSDEMRSFIQTLVQSEGVGISRSLILRNQAADFRHKRRLAAEERSQKAPVKMVFPTVIFILPVMFIVVLGPALQQASGLLHPR